jgi:hypothetical protein
MSNKFCRFLGNQYRFDINGIAPCCYYKKRIDFFDRDQFNNLHESLVNQSEWTEECSHCRMREDQGLGSPRQSSLLRPEFFGLSRDEDPDEITSIEIQTDTDCNGACLICGPHSSTTWQKHEAKFSNIKIIEHNKDNVDARFDRIKEIIDFSKLKTISFANGGETLKSDTHLKFLREINNQGNLKNIKLFYVSNGSIKPNEETIHYWKQAKEVNLSISIDGINEQFEYLRWPLQFSQVEDNLKYILSLDIPGLLAFSYAVTPFNAFYHDRYVDWSKEFFKDYYKTLKNLSIVEPFSHPFGTSGTINMNCVPPKLRFAIIKKFGANHQISKLVESFDSMRYQNFINYIELQDQRRGLNFREVFPEIESYFADSLKVKK